MSGDQKSFTEDASQFKKRLIALVDKFYIVLDEVSKEEEFEPYFNESDKYKSKTKKNYFSQIIKTVEAETFSKRSAVSEIDIEGLRVGKKISKLKIRTSLLIVIFVAGMISALLSTLGQWNGIDNRFVIIGSMIPFVFTGALSFVIANLSSQKKALDSSKSKLEKELDATETDILRREIANAYSLTISRSDDLDRMPVESSFMKIEHSTFKAQNELSDEAGGGGAEFTISIPRVSPRLVENEFSRIIAVASTSNTLEFIQEHVTSAIGITGPRGAGKSVLLKKVCQSINPNQGIGVIVPAPVEYDAIELMRRIAYQVYDSIAENDRGSILDKVYDHKNSSQIFQMRQLFNLIPFVLFAIAIYLIVFSFEDFSNSLFENYSVNVQQLFLGAGLFLSGIVWVTYFQIYSQIVKLKPQHNDDEDDIYLDIKKLVYELDYGSTFSNTDGSKISAKYFEQTSQSQVTTAVRELTLSQLTRKLRKSFSAIVDQAENAPPRSLFIAIDELDKLPNREAVIRTVNALKDLLHIDGVHFAVSLSDEALSAFELPITHDRDAFDSTFDTIFSVERMTLEESAYMLQERVANYPKELAYLACAWAAGLPRDIIRVARSLGQTARLLDGARVEPAGWQEVAFRVCRSGIIKRLQSIPLVGPQEIRSVHELANGWEVAAPTFAELKQNLSGKDERARIIVEMHLKFLAIWAIADSDEIMMSKMKLYLDASSLIPRSDFRDAILALFSGAKVFN